jgi:hypothetical protein
MLGNTASCVLQNGKHTKSRRAPPRAKPELHSEQIIILRIIKEGMMFWQIRRYLVDFEYSETRASETSRMITQLIDDRIRRVRWQSGASDAGWFDGSGSLRIAQLRHGGHRSRDVL